MEDLTVLAFGVLAMILFAFGLYSLYLGEFKGFGSCGKISNTAIVMEGWLHLLFKGFGFHG